MSYVVSLIVSLHMCFVHHARINHKDIVRRQKLFQRKKQLLTTTVKLSPHMQMVYINRLINGCGCDMVFIASDCVISRTSERSERVCDIIQPQAIKLFHTHNHYVTCLLHAYLYSRNQTKKENM